MCVGKVEQDTLLALGIVPLATTEWLGDPPPPGAIHPWAQDALGDAEPPQALKNVDGLQFERIAALRPDLILAIFSYIERGDHDRLSQIAPTVAQPKRSSTTPHLGSPTPAGSDKRWARSSAPRSW